MRVRRDVATAGRQPPCPLSERRKEASVGDHRLRAGGRYPCSRSL